MEHPELPRYELASRRRFLTRAAAFGAALAGAGALAGCGSDDTDSLGSEAATTTTTAAAAGGDATTTTAAAAGSGASSSGGTLPAGAKLDVGFTYTAESGGFGPARNPYVAAWVEDGDGALVATLGVWYNPPKGERWINHLESWYSAAGSADVSAVTGATRPAGTYSMTWDGTADGGDRVAAGTYTVFVESAREHGPHSLVSSTIDLGDAAATADLGTNGELSKVTATYAV